MFDVDKYFFQNALQFATIANICVAKKKKYHLDFSSKLIDFVCQFHFNFQLHFVCQFHL